MRFIMRIFSLLILIILTLGIIYVSFSSPTIKQEKISKQLPHDKIEIDEQ